MNLFDVPEEEYVLKSKIRLKDASLLAQKIQSEHAFNDPITVILDVGCGTGYSTLELSARFPHVRVIGIDSNPLYIENAPNITKNVEFYCFDITEGGKMEQFRLLTDLGESSVNIVVSTYWLTSLTDSHLNDAFSNINRLLRPNGFLYILDLIWSAIHPIIYRLNQTNEWNEIIERKIRRISNDTISYKLSLPESETAPTTDQINAKWFGQFEPFESSLELFQLVLNRRTYEFETMNDMLNVLESMCATLQYLDDDDDDSIGLSSSSFNNIKNLKTLSEQSLQQPPPSFQQQQQPKNSLRHRYFVQFIENTFDHCIFQSRELKLSYHCLLVIGMKK